MRRGIVGLRAAAAVLAVALVWASAPALASEVPAGSAEDTNASVRTVGRLKFPAGVAQSDESQGAAGFWVWPEGQRGYFLADHARVGGFFAGTGLRDEEDPNQLEARPAGFAELVMVDLETGTELQRVPLNPPGLRLGTPRAVTVDREHGRVFVAYGVNPATGAREGTTCAMTYLRSSCLGGVHVFDAATLEALGRMRWPAAQVDGALLWPYLRAMTYTPPAPAGGSDENQGGGEGKLLLVVEDWGLHLTAANATAYGDQLHVRGAGANLSYAVQFDVASGRRDWMVRLEACRFSREQPPVGRMGGEDRPHPAAIFERVRPDGGRAVYVGCHSSGQQAVFVELELDEAGNPPPAGMPVQVRDPGRAAGSVADGGEASDAQVVAPTAGIRQFAGPDFTKEIVADAVSGRFLLKVVDKQQQVWWVFDVDRWEVLGTIGIGQAKYSATTGSISTTGFDHDSGRLYTLAPHGLYLTDIRRNPLGQALAFPTFGELAPDNTWLQEITVASASGGRSPRLYWRNARTKAEFLWVVEDGVAVSVDVDFEGFEGRTLDLDEAEGVTAASLDGAARGFGFRALLISGAEGAARVGPADPVGKTFRASEFGYRYSDSAGLPWAVPLEHECLQGNREVVAGFVGPEGPAVVDGSGARGSAQPVLVDDMTRQDADAPVSRCGLFEWQRLWGVGLFGQPPVSEPTVPWVVATTPAQCVTSEDEAADQVGESSALGGFAAAVRCDPQEASGFGYTRGVEVAGVQLGEALSSYRIYRDPGRGMVARVESVSRGFQIPGVLRIDTVRGVAESWANGRVQPVPAAEREAGYDPNCDFDRTAGTCFTRHVFGVWTPGYSCGPCGDEQEMLERMNRGFGAHGRVRLRNPDPVLAAGAENGFAAAVTKPDFERFSDLVLNADLLQTVVPTLEVIRYTAPNRPQDNEVADEGRGLPRPAPRGRQIYQFAGVEVSSSYGISCLLVYDEEANTCAAPVEEPGGLVIELTDPDGQPLAGGAFEVRADTDGDGVLGLVDALIPDGACVTAEDGIGTCTWEHLEPGSYIISQVAAPPGYAVHDEPWVSELAPGEARTVTFVNVSNISVVEVTVTDADGAPLEDAQFALYADADGDGSPDGEPIATCTTDADGVCAMAVPVGGYVLVQQSAPDGLEPIEPVAFALTAGGQTAAVGIVNYPPLDGTGSGISQPPPAAAPEVVFDAPAPFIPVESGGFTPPAHDSGSRFTPALPQITEAVGGTIVRVIRAPADAMRLLTRDPKEAVAWMAVMLLFAMAAMAIRRRQHATELLGG